MSSPDTREQISQSFKKLMMKKSFDKITISDISNECGINRQTFYYHFRDKYELLNTIFYNDVIAELIDGLSIDNWTEKFLKMLQIIKKDSKLYRNALNISYGGEFRDYLLDISKKLLYEIIGHLTEEHPIDDYNRMFLARFFAHGVSGMIIDWVTTGMKEEPEEITHHLKEIIDGIRYTIAAKGGSEGLSPQDIKQMLLQ